ncbi:phosphate ABC transporter permease PstA [Rubellicoccus peritrichatus]|uniref:Phosphate transport system permease protein PstA n=1 Tax=Rubellicoccus peritrichatus TaxID=3080537 RepID=A0AAQ3LAR9_9BACT|nr:phosphate ABC transporter permease PstA [Puniceicoccus sp. CR14]WOO42246.1 phosphate ABC transporter permease PstA [Puniceicoccus sp. CR14]
MNQQNHNKVTKKRSGVLPVWLLGAGLATGLLMIGLLFVIIIMNGLAVFWPREVVLITLHHESGAGPGGRTEFGASILDQRSISGSSEGSEEYYLYVGSDEVLGDKFHYIPLEDVIDLSKPKAAMVAERYAHGSALLIPESLEDENGAIVMANSPQFNEALKKAISNSAEKRKALHDLESGDIAKVNRALEMLAINERKLLNNSTQSTQLEELRKERTALEKRHESLAAIAQSLRDEANQAKLYYRLLSGEAITQPIQEILSVHQPNAMGIFDKIWYFITHFIKYALDDPREGNTEGGIFPIIVGTFVLTILMSIVVMPLGVIAAIYLREYARPGPIVQFVRIAVSNLAGVPSIVYGVFGLGFFVYFLGGHIDTLFFSDRLPSPTFGTGGIIWAALTLALLTVPVVIVATEESLAAFPQGIREASLACGASRFQTLIRIILPASAPGMITGLVLAIARAAGEVAPLMLVGVVAFAPDLPFDQIAPYVHLDRKFMHMGYHIYSLGFLTQDSEAAKPMVFATTFLLIMLVVVLNIGAMLLRDKMRKRYSSETF